MRTFQCAVVAASLLAASFASAQMNPTNITLDSKIPDDVNEIAGEIAVEVSPDLSSSDLRALKAEYGLHSTSEWADPYGEIDVLDTTPSNEGALIEKMQHDPRIRVAERQQVFRASGFVPNDPLYGKQWSLPRINAPTSYAYSNGYNVSLAVVDTGIDCKLSDFNQSRCKLGYNFISDNENATDDQGHGSFCASEIGSVVNNGLGVAGIADGVSLLAVKVLSSSGSGSSASVANGIDYATDHNVQIISMSLGAHSPDRLIEAAVNRALAKKISVVAAAGNSSGSVGWPAAYPGVVAVSATDEHDQIASFSSRGPEVALAAPGVNIVAQTIDGKGGGHFPSFSGTSMSTPETAAGFATVVSLGLRGDAAKEAVVNNTTSKDDPNLYGSGVLNVGKAVRSVYWSQFAWRTGLLFLLAFALKRHINKLGGLSVKPGVLAMLFTATGLVPFLPLTGILPKLGAFRLGAELAMRPFGMWDIPLLGLGVHSWLPLASCIPAVMMLLLCYGVKALRPQIGGVALGSAALLSQLVIQNDGDWGGLFRLFMLANIGVAMWIARVVLDGKMDGNNAVVPPAVV